MKEAKEAVKEQRRLKEAKETEGGKGDCEGGKGG